jgi:hypothetical protein
MSNCSTAFCNPLLNMVMHIIPHAIDKPDALFCPEGVQIPFPGEQEFQPNHLVF